jgi:hypothetical protein
VTDLAAAAVHDIEETLLHGRDFSIMALDIESAFDTVLLGHLICRLQ